MFIFTQHALKKMDALGLNRKDIERTIKEGMKWKEKEGNKMHAQMAGVEVVFMRQDVDFFIITVYLARRSK